MFPPNTSRKSRTLLAGTVAALSLVMTPMCVTSAIAAGQGSQAEGQGQGHGQGQGAHGMGVGGQHGKGGRSMTDIFRDVTGAGDDSDRPEWAEYRLQS